MLQSVGIAATLPFVQNHNIDRRQGNKEENARMNAGKKKPKHRKKLRYDTI